VISLKISDNDNRSLQLSISTPAFYVEIIFGVLFAILVLVVACFYIYKKCFKPNLATPRPIRAVRKRLTERLGLSDLFTPERSQDHEPILTDANADEIVQMNDVSPA